MLTRLFAILALFMAVSPASAVVYSDHFRLVEAVANVGGGEVETRSTTAPGIWNETVFEDQLVGEGGAATAQAYQLSAFSDELIIMGGNLNAAAISSFPEVPIASASATSHLSTNFTVTIPNTHYISQFTAFRDAETEFYLRPAGSSGS
jgi:hypothetical protein